VRWVREAQYRPARERYMTGDMTPPSAAEDSGARTESMDLAGDERPAHERLFLPGVFTSACDVEFTIDDVKAALFESTYSNPKYLEFKLDDTNMMRVAVEAVRAVYTTYNEGLGCFETPDWMIYGWLPKSGYDPYPDIARVRCFLSMDQDDIHISEAEVQRVPSGGSGGGINEINNPPD
jgi:hypothetical protein